MALQVLWIWLNHDEELYVSKISALSRVRDELCSDHFKSIFNSYTLMKTSENLRFSDVFRRYKNVILNFPYLDINDNSNTLFWKAIWNHASNH